MYVIEFFADKVPYLDTGWDALHTFIRVPAGAILAARSLGDMNPALELMALLAGGSIALVAHGTKAATRLALNASPEPFSNWVASVGEDVTVFGSIWLMFNHPVIMGHTPILRRGLQPMLIDVDQHLVLGRRPFTPDVALIEGNQIKSFLWQSIAAECQ